MTDTSVYGPSFFEGRSETVARSAQIVVPVLVDLFDPRSVLDVGCGKGEWLHAFDLEDTVGVDISAGNDHLDSIARSLATFGKSVRDAIDIASDLRDAGTADLFTEISREVDKQLYFLESHIQA